MATQDNESKQVVERFWAAMHANDFHAAGELLHDEYVLEWPQSGERIRGRANFVAVNFVNECQPNKRMGVAGDWTFVFSFRIR